MPDAGVGVFEVAHLNTTVGKPSVVDEDVDRAKRRLRAFHTGADRVQVRDVKGDGLRSHPEGANLRRAGLCAVRVKIVNDQVRARVGQLLRDSEADAPACSGDERDLTFKRSHSAFVPPRLEL